MILVKPSHKIIQVTDRPLHLVEEAGRTCYKSESKVTITSAGAFAGMILDKGHESVLEHASVTVRIVCDRGVSHELVRHRLSSFSQESTRYCNYRGGVAFVIPPWIEHLSEGEYDGSEFGLLNSADFEWAHAMLDASSTYKRMIDYGWKPEQARSVLPNSTKTEVVMTTNLREWRHIFKLRTANAAHPQMREIMRPMLKDFQETIPVIFDDITY